MREGSEHRLDSGCVGALPAHFQQTACAILVARHGFESTEVALSTRNANTLVIEGKPIGLTTN